MDLVKVYVLFLKLLFKNESNIFNFGNGNGFFVLEIVEVVCKVINKEIICKIVVRRKGDFVCVIVFLEKVKKILGWKV